MAVYLSALLFADAPGSELLPTGHWVYDALFYLSVETGQTTLAVHTPASLNEIQLYLDAIPYDDLSSNGQKLYQTINETVSTQASRWKSGVASISLKPAVSATVRSRSDSDAWFDFDAIDRFNNTKPLLSLPLLATFTPAVSVFADFSVGEGYWSSGLSDNYTSIPSSSDSFDINIPKTAYLSAGNAFCTAVIGRGSLTTGRTLSGSMILSDNADRLDYASLVLFSPRIRMSLTPVELAPNRFVYFHDLSFRPLKGLSLGFSEAASVNSTVDPRYLNPVMVFHSYAGWRDTYDPDSDTSPVGTQFAVSVDVVPSKGIRLYTQLVMNQFQTSYELKTSTEAATIPNSLGGLAGLESVHAFRRGYLIGTIEGVYTNPWLYVLSNHGISYYWTRKELVAPSGYASREIQGWLGSPFGPDTIACLLNLTYDVPMEYKAVFQYRFICRGRNGGLFLSDSADDYYPKTESEASTVTPSGGTLYQNSLSLSGSRKLSRQLEIEGKLGYSTMSGDYRAQSVDAECTVTWLLW